ncbi:protein kinase domain-containing protein [Microbulbifer sp. PAAF003]|uniref:protein kinase domain-containing protein n=1 Tax=Microbulbifer sp. PAAF003 TaxID=3243375 RepID=UPI004039BA78
MDVVALEKTEEYQGRYRVERTLGAGGMGVVYLAEDVKLGRKVAIKQLRSDMTGNSAEARFRSEAQLLARLNHPNIVRLYDVLEEKHNIALVMELVEGVTLKEWMRETSPTLAEKLDLLMQICQGLGKAHCLGIIHRDLKPENILVTDDGIAKITDFGIAKALDCDQQLTREDHIAGSVQAMSPEQLQGAKLDARSDLFSLGSIAYELLCNEKPFERGEMGALAFAQQITTKPHTPPQKTWPEIPRPLIALLDRLLAKRPEQRPDSAQQVFEALELVHKHGINEDTQQYSETVTQLLIKPKKQRRRIGWAVAGLAAISGIGFWVWHTFMQLPPQYIAVLPVKINGSLNGGKESEVLVSTMVRQALMSTPTQLKSSTLVSFNPNSGSSTDEQLNELRNKGITDALFAHLECLESRCNIELQRINPASSEVKQRENLVFLSNQRQEAQFSISNIAVELFAQAYREESTSEIRMTPEDYSSYLTVASRIRNTTVKSLEESMEELERLISKYPRNTNLYTAYSDAAVRVFSHTNDNKVLTSALAVLINGDDSGADEVTLLEAKLQIKSIGADKKGFESTLNKLQSKGHPSAHLLAEFARFNYIQGNYEQGVKYALQAIDLNPSTRTNYILALNQFAVGDYEPAKKILNKLIQKEPDYWSSYAVLGAIQLEQGNLAEAEKTLTTIPKEFHSWGMKSNLGTILLLRGKYKDAQAIYFELLKRSPENLVVLNQIAETYLMLGNRTKANEYFGKLLNVTSEKSDLRTKQYRAIALANLEQTAASVALVMELLRESPEDTYIRHTATQVYAMAGEWQSANYYLEQLLNKGMSTEWFALPAFQKLCAQPQTSKKVLQIVCKASN